MTSPRIIVSGYSSFDRMVKVDKSIEVGTTSLITNQDFAEIYWGGCSVNVSVALNKLGVKATPVLRVGNDFEKSGFKDFLESNHVPLDAIKEVITEKNSSSILVQSNDGEHVTLFYPGAMDEAHFINYEDEWFANNQHALITVGSQADNQEFLRLAKKHQLAIYFGMKGDFSAFPADFLKDILSSSKIIFMNDAERKQIEQLLELTSISEIFDKGAAEIVVITLGSKGSMYYERSHKSEIIAPVKPTNIKDTTGGGDGFISGFLYGYFNGYSLPECCKLGSTVSSFVLEETGCCTNLPSEIKLLERYKKE